MKQVNNLLHFTRDLETVKNILKEGFKASYAVESLGNRKILIPMVSFSNLLFRDVGEDEVVDYGHYGIGINREYAVKSRINPVIYLYENSQIDKAISSLLHLTIIPQGLDSLQKITQVKNFTKITDYVNFNPIPDEVKEIIDTIDKSTSENLISAITKYAKKAHENVYHQILLSKPYKVKNKKNEIKIAYNEREWRKGFSNLGFEFETDLKGAENPEYKKWIKTAKPHFNQPENILNIDIEHISHIILANGSEITEMNSYLNDLYPNKNITDLVKSGKLNIGTLEMHKTTEKN